MVLGPSRIMVMKTFLVLHQHWISSKLLRVPVGCKISCWRYLFSQWSWTFAYCLHFFMIFHGFLKKLLLFTSVLSAVLRLWALIGAVIWSALQTYFWQKSDKNLYNIQYHLPETKLDCMLLLKDCLNQVIGSLLISVEFENVDACENKHNTQTKGFYCVKICTCVS